MSAIESPCTPSCWNRGAIAHGHSPSCASAA